MYLHRKGERASERERGWGWGGGGGFGIEEGARDRYVSGWVEIGYEIERESEACHVLRRSHTSIRADKLARARSPTLSHILAGQKPQDDDARSPTRACPCWQVRSLKMMMLEQIRAQADNAKHQATHTRKHAQTRARARVLSVGGQRQASGNTRARTTRARAHRHTHLYRVHVAAAAGSDFFVTLSEQKGPKYLPL